MISILPPVLFSLLSALQFHMPDVRSRFRKFDFPSCRASSSQKDFQSGRDCVVFSFTGIFTSRISPAIESNLATSQAGGDKEKPTVHQARHTHNRFTPN